MKTLLKELGKSAIRLTESICVIDRSVSSGLQAFVAVA